MVKLSRMDCAVPVECTAADLPLATWLELLGPGGELHLHMSPAMTPGFSIPLLLAGYVDVELVDSGKGGNTVVTAYKPKWKTGAFAKVAHETRHVERVVESTAMDDEYAAEDDDLIDESGLLGRGDVRADALGSVLQVHVGRFWGPLGWDTFLVSDLGWETGFGLLSPS